MMAGGVSRRSVPPSCVALSASGRPVLNGLHASCTQINEARPVVSALSSQGPIVVRVAPTYWNTTAARLPWATSISDGRHVHLGLIRSRGAAVIFRAFTPGLHEWIEVRLGGPIADDRLDAHQHSLEDKVREAPVTSRGA
jgi:hypothetical protein